jgi:hypothetical protein
VPVSFPKVIPFFDNFSGEHDCFGSSNGYLLNSAILKSYLKDIGVKVETCKEIQLIHLFEKERHTSYVNIRILYHQQYTFLAASDIMKIILFIKAFHNEMSLPFICKQT